MKKHSGEQTHRRWRFGWGRLSLSLFAVVSSIAVCHAQTGMTHVVPLVVDGQLTDGTFYSSELFVTNLASLEASCEVTAEGIDPDRFADATMFTLEGVTVAPPPSFAEKIFGPPSPPRTPRASWASISTSGQQPITIGFATLNCTQGVDARLVYKLASQTGDTITLAVAGSAQSSTLSQFPVMHDQNMGKRLGLAVLNDSDTDSSYDIVFTDLAGSAIGNSIEIPGGSILVKFLDEIVNLPNGPAEGTVTILSDQAFYSVVLIFDGAAFTTLGAIPLYP